MHGKIIAYIYSLKSTELSTAIKSHTIHNEHTSENITWLLQMPCQSSGMKICIFHTSVFTVKSITA